MRIPATGGEPQPIRRAGERPGWKAVRWPAVLPDGLRFLYFVRSDDPEVQGIYLGDLRRDDAAGDAHVLAADSNVFFGAGHLAFVRRGELFAQPFDLDTGRTTGPAFPVAERIDQDPYDDGFAFFTLSHNGVLVYRGGVTPDRQLRWFDRAGGQIGAVDEPGEYRDLALTRDGRRLAFERMDPRHGTRDIWIQELDRPARLRLTSTADEDGAPVWAPGGGSLVFAGLRDRSVSLLHTPAAGGAETVLLETIGFPVDWSPDGTRLAMEVEVPGEGVNLMFFDLATRRLTPYLATPFMEREAQFSPDGALMAYSSSESGQREIYVEPVPRDGRRWKVSDDFGREPRWRGDGRELFYLGRENTLMAVPVTASPGGVRFGRPAALFRVRIRGADVRFHYAVTPAGDRFLVNTVVEDVPGTPLNVWEHWLSGLD
jgi:dipeptidyl aminopeptidase/acylaminoacyl peptidase